MRLYLVVQPADLDWSHTPTLLGVYTTLDAAERRQRAHPYGYGPHGPESRVLMVEADTDLTNFDIG